MRKSYAKKIDARATQLLRELKLMQVPIDVGAVASQLGAHVVFEDLDDDVSGFLLRDKSVMTIAINKDHHIIVSVSRWRMNAATCTCTPTKAIGYGSTKPISLEMAVLAKAINSLKSRRINLRPGCSCRRSSFARASVRGARSVM